MISGFSKDPLINLIRSLSSSEKRYFKLYSSHHVKRKKTNYVELFEAIEREAEREGKESYRDFKTSRLPQLKKELYEIILKSLSAYHYRSTTENTLSSNLQHIDLFIKKGLFKEARKIIATARNIAEAYENFSFLIILLQKELLIRSVEIEEDKKDAYDLYQVIFQNIERLKNNIEYQVLQVNFRNLMMERKSTSLRKLKKVVMNNPLMLSEEKALSTFAKTTFLNLHSIYNRAVGDAKAAHYYGKRLVTFFETTPNLIEKSSFNYASFLLNATGYEVDLGIYDNVFNNIAKLRKLSFSSDKERGYIYGSALTLELVAYINLGKIEDALANIPRQEKQLNENKRFLIEETFILVYYGWSVIYFISGQYKKAIKSINKIIHSPEFAAHRVDIHVEARIFKLLIYFEAGNTEMLEYFLDETYLYVEKADYLSDKNKCILDFLKEYIKGNKAIKSKSFFSLKADLMKNNSVKGSQGYFDVLLWIESKIQQVSMAEIIRLKRAGKIFFNR